MTSSDGLRAACENTRAWITPIVGLVLQRNSLVSSPKDHLGFLDWWNRRKGIQKHEIFDRGMENTMLESEEPFQALLKERHFPQG